jgi:hypothetical protein
MTSCGTCWMKVPSTCSMLSTLVPPSPGLAASLLAAQLVLQECAEARIAGAQVLCCKFRQPVPFIVTPAAVRKASAQPSHPVQNRARLAVHQQESLDSTITDPHLLAKKILPSCSRLVHTGPTSGQQIGRVHHTTALNHSKHTTARHQCKWP